MTTLYVKRGRKYVPHVETWDRDHDRMGVGEFRLTYCYRAGDQRYQYSVTPDTAGFVAAAMVAEVAMEDAIIAASMPQPSPRPYTPEQLVIIERFRAEMQAAGALLPDWWQHARAIEVVRAGVDAVRKFAP